ncbi:MAG TPA: hypothetical protein PLU30_01495 [Verrucomicrobiae bacterium]|nr:hypothetical protein [Verrucomicrobiae bacterium]
MKKLAAIVLAFSALGAAAMAHGGFSISFGYSDCGRSYYRPSYYGYCGSPVVVYPYRSYCHRPLYRRYCYRPYSYGYWPSYGLNFGYRSYGHHHGSHHHYSHHRGHHHGHH